jgi:hypothetical protein
MTLNKRELPYEYHNTIKKCNYQDCLLMLQQPCVRKEFGKWVIIYLLFSPIMLVPLHCFLSSWTIFQLVKYLKFFDNYKINAGQWHEDFVVFWQYIIKRRGVSHMVALPFTLKRHKKELWKLKYFIMQQYNLQKNLLRETKILQDIIIL